MQVVVATDWLITVLLISVRLGMILTALPMKAVVTLPAKIRLVLVLVFSALMASLIPSSLSIASLPSLLAALATEFVVGLVMGCSLMVMFSSLLIAGRLVDFQSGFSAAAVLNPASGTQNSLLGTLLLLMGTAFFFAVDAHHELLRGVVYSLKVFPPGQAIQDMPDLLDAALFGGTIFLYGMLISAPVLAGLFIMDLAFSAMARTMPQMNPYFIALPAKVFAGMALLALSFSQISPVLENLFSVLFQHWVEVLNS